MHSAFTYPDYPFRPSPDAAEPAPVRHPVVIVGAGPIGLVAALDLARLGRRVVVLDEDNTVSVGSRAICWSKRTLEICERIGVADALIERGIQWKLGRVFHKDRELYSFDLLPETGHRMPAFVNLQQYHFEAAAVDAAEAHPLIDLRWRSRVSGVEPGDGNGPVRVDIETPEGPYAIAADWLLACDGAKSPIRRMLSLDFEGHVFQDRFLIADVVMTADFPTERWFWFDPPFNPGQSALLHKQANDVWRIDLQLGPDADPEAAKKPENVIPRLKRMLGPDTAFELEWVSVYTFQCRRLARFRHGRILFAGDSAHQVSPFGARGGNGGIQDVDNLCWKLDRVLRGSAPESLLDSYDAERGPAADENILNSTRSTDFITPKTAVSRDFRDAVLALAGRYGFARRLVNSGRLSVPAVLSGSPLSTPDAPGETFAGAMVPGAACADAPVAGPDGDGWLLNALTAPGGFVLLAMPGPDGLPALPEGMASVVIGEGGYADRDGLVAARYDLRSGGGYLIRPDNHVAARFRRLEPGRIAAALARATGREASAERTAWESA